ncbi:MAG: hypothetical protein PHF84_10845, partial [bacterium]|nr:hypothetical protein [bacterium]
MKKKNILLVRSFLFLFALICLPFSGFTANKTHYVNRNNPSPSPPYLTVLSAAQQIQDVIIICNITNYERIVVLDDEDYTVLDINGRQNIRIMNTNLSFYPRIVATGNNRGVDIRNSSRIRIQNIRITNANNDGIRIENSTQCTIVRVHSYSNSENGLRFNNN